MKGMEEQVALKNCMVYKDHNAKKVGLAWLIHEKHDTYDITSWSYTQIYCTFVHSINYITWP